jgi:hypothetical protein
MSSPSTKTFTRRVAQHLLLLQVLLLLIGTQMPGAWRAGIVDSLHAPSVVSSLAHFVLFAGMATVAHAKPLAWPWRRVLLLTLGLALLTEGLQFFAIDRHPRLIDVFIDLAGAIAGLLLIIPLNRFLKT